MTRANNQLTKRVGHDRSFVACSDSLAVLGDKTNQLASRKPPPRRRSQRLVDEKAHELRRSARLILTDENAVKEQNSLTIDGPKDMPSDVVSRGPGARIRKNVHRKSGLIVVEERKRTRREESKSPNPRPSKKKSSIGASKDKDHSRNVSPRSEPENAADNHTLVMQPFNAEQFTRSIAVNDLPGLADELETVHYVTDIMQRLYEAEDRFSIQPFAKYQSFVPSKTRLIAVDWICRLQCKLELEAETFYLAVHIFDRFGSTAVLPESDVQKVATTALWIASKYHDIYAPEVYDLTDIADDCFASEDLIEMEITVLKALSFRISAPTAFPFLKRFLHWSKASRTMSFVASYYLERAIHLQDSLKFRPSELAAAAVCLAICQPEIRHDILCEPEEMTTEIEQYSTFPRSRTRKAAALIAKAFRNRATDSDGREILCVGKKYAASRYEGVSGLPPPTLAQLAFK